MPELLNLLSTGSPARTIGGSLSVRPRDRALIVARSPPCDERRSLVVRSSTARIFSGADTQ
jgi:hypothetical protein